MPPLTSSTIELPWQRQQLRVPREDGSVLVSLRKREAVAALEQNRRQLNEVTLRLCGRSLPDFRRWTHETVLHAAANYTARLIQSPLPEIGHGPIAVTGHQPALSHAGVWVKNFAVADLAAATGGTGLNLVVDTDTCSNTQIRIPTGTPDAPAIATVAFDQHRSAQPWENLEIKDETTFRRFPEQVLNSMPDLSYSPLLSEFWASVGNASRKSTLWVDCLTAARQQLERRWGLRNLELPISHLCRLEPFLAFTLHVLMHLETFRDIHNQVLRQYREVNRVRSHTHPVPELQVNGDWVEAPFWVWHSGDLRRKHVFSKRTDCYLLLSDGSDVFAELPLSEYDDPTAAIDVLKTLPSRQIHLRSRALTTTLFARLCLSDLFVHGIGGAKYDEMTDRIIARFFHLMPPTFLTLSATLHLPIGQPFDVDDNDQADCRRRLRDLCFNPQRHMPPDLDQATATLVQRKLALMDEQLAAKVTGLSRRERRQRSIDNRRRFLEFRTINSQLKPAVAERYREVQQQLDQTHRQLMANRVLKDREFAVVLFPEQKLRDFFGDFWRK